MERTGTPGTFIGYNGNTSSFALSKLVVTAAGVTASQSNGNVVSGSSVDIKGGNGNLALSSTGLLVSRSTLSLASNYRYETSSDLKLWTAAAGVTETVLATQAINGVSTDTVQADVVLPDMPQGFVRIRWMQTAH